MTAPSQAELRRWLVDYLIAYIGCETDNIDLDAPFVDLGIASRDAVVLSGELAELVGRAVSPLELWQHPTVNALVEFLTTPESEIQAGMQSGAVDSADRAGFDEPVAVVGVGCRLPGEICGPDGLWEFLCAGRSAVGEVPADRWARFDDGSAQVAAALAGTTRWGSFLTDVDSFDAEFFEISPREAATMDPQQRLVLEVAYEALEHAGIRADALRRTQTGVFVGACAGEYGYMASADLSAVDAFSGTGGALSIIANRVSYFFDLRGPSVTVDTACSSSLVALHLAGQSLRSGESNLAIVAGVNLVLSPAVTRSFDAAEAMSATGRCRAFDADADGFVRGEGCGAVVLKRLSDALRDGDSVLAVVRGSAVNQDGRSNGLMAPNPAAQMAVLHAAYANAGVPAHEVDYVEANATGTLLGDPIEARALGTVLGRARPQSAPLLIGSVKSNLGHLDAAAGIVGFIKAVLAVQRGHIPANLDFGSPNPHIPFDELGLQVVAAPTDWPVTDYPRRAGVSSFGFGGTNAHVVVEQRPDPVAVGAVGAGFAAVVTTLVVGGKTDERVASMAQMLAQWMDGAGADVSLADVAHTVNHHRGRQSRFATVAACDRAQAVAGLHALAAGRSAQGVVAPHRGQCRAGTVFVYSGQGSQWPGMGRQLLADEPVFAAAVDELEPIFVSQAGFSLHQVLAGGEPVTGIERIQPVLVGMGLALTKLWRSYGVHPDAVIGHSMGEVTAAVVAGALSAGDGLRVITTRSKLLARLSGQGAMALPDSPLLDSVLPELRIALADVAPRPTRIPVIVTTGAEPVFDADYWAESLRVPVRFSQAVAAAGADYGTFMEVSPHPVLTDAISDTLGEDHHHSIGTLQRDTHDTLTFHTNLNRTHTTRPPDVDHPAEPHPVIPTTPWHHTRHWLSTPEPPLRQPAPHWLTITERLEAAVSAPRSSTVLGEHVTIATTPAVHLWQAWLKPEAKPYPGAYRVQGVEVVPISVLLQTLSSAASECGALALSDVRFEHAIVVDEPRVIQVVADGESVTISSGSTAGSSADRWIRHASARILHTPQDVEPDRTVHSRTQEMSEYDASSVTGSRQKWGIEGQPFEWSIDSCRSTPDAFRADVLVPEASTVALVDAAVDVVRLLDGSGPRLLVPVAAESVRLHTGLADCRGVVEVRRRDGNGDELIVDIVAMASDGSTCVDIRSLRYEAASQDESATITWSQVSEEQLFSELETKLQTILARELGMPASAVAVDRGFPELGLDSTMAMTVLRETTRVVGFEVPATMLWEHPTIASLAGCLAEAIATPEATDDVSEEDFAEVTLDSPSSVLDELFDHVEESAPAGSERGSL